MLKLIFGWAWGLADIAIFLFIVIIVMNSFSNFFYKIIYNLTTLYINMRTVILRWLLKSNPNSSKIKDMYKRSLLHHQIFSLQNYLIYLTETCGSFEVCPQCKFPHKPNIYSCPNCKYTPEENFIKVKNFLSDTD